MFPIQRGPAIPWHLIAPHEAQAQRNHGQTLERLAQRGGLDPIEAMCVLEDREYPQNYNLDPHVEHDRLVACVRDAELATLRASNAALLARAEKAEAGWDAAYKAVQALEVRLSEVMDALVHGECVCVPGEVTQHEAGCSVARAEAAELKLLGLRSCYDAGEDLLDKLGITRRGADWPKEFSDLGIYGRIHELHRSLTARVSALEAALRPFAEAFAHDPNADDAESLSIVGEVTMCDALLRGDFRWAAVLLAPAARRDAPVSPEAPRTLQTPDPTGGTPTP